MISIVAPSINAQNGPEKLGVENGYVVVSNGWELSAFSVEEFLESWKEDPRKIAPTIINGITVYIMGYGLQFWKDRTVLLFQAQEVLDLLQANPIG